MPRLGRIHVGRRRWWKRYPRLAPFLLLVWIARQTKLFIIVNVTPDDDRSQPIGPRRALSAALRRIREAASDDSNPAASCPAPAWVDPGRTHCRGISFPNREVRGCGAKAEFQYTDHPYGWECRLKERLQGAIRNNSLSGCAFGFLDVGTAGGDWAMVLAANNERARFAAIEAHPLVFVEMLRNMKANRLLAHNRVAAYPFAVGVLDARNGQNAKGNVSVSWPDSKYVRVSSWPGSTLCLPTVKQVNGHFQASSLNVSSDCEGADVPIVSIDLILEDWQESHLATGGLFAAKVDIEGAERDAVESAARALGDPGRRPCLLYLELKVGAAYAEAVGLLEGLGYARYVDVDSGVSGRGSYPPRGTWYRNEGNYEFRLPEEEFAECVDRTRRATCGAP